MPAPEPERSTVDDLLASISEIDKALGRFQRNLLPQVRALGINLSGWALNFGENYRRASQDLYTQVDQRAQERGSAYLYFDLPDLENARRMADQADRLQRAGLITAQITETGVWAAGIYQKAAVRAAIMMQMLDLQKRLPTLRARAARAGARIDRFLANDDRLFRILVARRTSNAVERTSVDRDLRRVVESYRRLYEARARLGYYQAVFDVVANFEPPRFIDSMRELEQTGVRDRQMYLLEGNSYLQRLDGLLASTGWDGPYYRTDLPDGLRFFLGEGRSLLPPGARLRSVDACLDRMRTETPSPTSPVAYTRAIFSLWRATGDPLVLYPASAATIRRVLILVGLIVLALIFVVTGAAAAAANGAAVWLASVWKQVANTFPVNTTGQALALALVGLLLLPPLIWLVLLLLQKPRL